MRKYYDPKYSLFFACWTKMRDLIFSVCVVTLIYQTPYFTLMAYNFLALSQMIFVGFYKPFVSKFDNWLEMLNEFSILIINYHYMCLTDFVSDA